MWTDSLASDDFVEFYRCMVEEEGRVSALPMLELARRLRLRPYASDVPGSTSHEHMVLGARDGDSVAIGYLEDAQVFAVTHFDATLHRDTNHRVTAEQIDSLIDALIQRLLVSRPPDNAETGMRVDDRAEPSSGNRP